MVNIAIIGGTGFSDKVKDSIDYITDYGHIKGGTLNLGRKEVYLFTRHSDLDVPHRVNTKGNILTAKILGVDVIYGVTAGGRLHKDVLPGHLVAVSDMDWDDSTPASFADDGHLLLHVTMSPAFSQGLREILNASWQDVEKRVGDLYANSDLSVGYHENGTYFNIHGPGFSTPAREHRLRQTVLNPRIIGQTIRDEAYLARELGIAYAALAMCVDHSNYPNARHVTHVDGVMQAVKKTAEAAYMLLDEAIENIPDEFYDPVCHDSLKHALHREQIDLEKLAKKRPKLADILRKELENRRQKTY